MSASEPETPKPDHAVGQMELPNELGDLKAENESLRQELEQLRQEMAEQASIIVSNREERNRLRAQVEKDHADRSELAQLKKEAKDALAEIHREGRSIELEKTRSSQQLSDARAELADAKASILAQGNKIRELERGYSLKPSPAESALRLEIGNLRAELEACKQQPATDFELPEAADLLNQLKGQRKKSKTDLADVEAILEMLGGEDG